MLPGTAAEVAAGGVALVLDPALAPREDRPARMIVPRGGSLAIRRATHGLRQPATINGVPVPTAWLNADEKCRVLSRTHAHLRCRRRRNSSSDVLLLYDGSPHELTKSVNGSTVDGVPVPPSDTLSNAAPVTSTNLTTAEPWAKGVVISCPR